MLRSLLPIAVLAGTTVLAGCGNAVDAEPPSGLTGVSVSARGDVAIEAYVCRGTIDTIEIVRDREGLADDEENPLVRRYTADERLDGAISLELTHPEPGWKPRKPTTFDLDAGYIVTAQSDDGETVQLNLDGDALTSLEPGSIYVSDDPETNRLTRLTPAAFAAQAKKLCA